MMIDDENIDDDDDDVCVHVFKKNSASFTMCTASIPVSPLDITALPDYFPMMDGGGEESIWLRIHIGKYKEKVTFQLNKEVE